LVIVTAQQAVWAVFRCESAAIASLASAVSDFDPERKF
jgi:hypothetical protein